MDDGIISGVLQSALFIFGRSISSAGQIINYHKRKTPKQRCQARNAIDFLPRMLTMQTLPPVLPRHMSAELR